MFDSYKTSNTAKYEGPCDKCNGPVYSFPSTRTDGDRTDLADEAKCFGECMQLIIRDLLEKGRREADLAWQNRGTMKGYFR